jgi:multimeric flavodoxin WrbA
MNNKLCVIFPNSSPSLQLTKMLKAAIGTYDAIIVDGISQICNLNNKNILFCLELDELGNDLEMLNYICFLFKSNKDVFKNSTGALLVHSRTELYTKRAAQDMIFICNSLGCSFIGHPLVEATGSLKNFLTWQKTMNCTLDYICLQMCEKLVLRLMQSTTNNVISDLKLTVIFSTPHKTSNTMDLWKMVKDNLNGCEFNEIQIENGKIHDCKGCSFKTCLHYAKQNSCFYGGAIVESVLPSIEKADTIVWLCPNYNDALSANITAVINRLTVLYRRIDFHNKNIFSIVVSGNSGSDSIAKQLIGALNINKGFRLPAGAFLLETANDPLSIFKVEGIKSTAKCFAENMLKQINSSG